MTGRADPPRHDRRATAPTSHELAPGSRVGPFTVETVLGRGATATVYAVRRDGDDTVLALKLLQPIGRDPGLRSRFRREFRALSRLLYPNVLRVHEWGIHDDRPWFTMERVEGVELGVVIEEHWKDHTPDERFEAVHQILLQLTRALAYVHDRGMVHRDVCPGNIMVRADGTVKLMDFGLVTDRTTELTQHGEVLGTVAYTAPEQIQGGTVDARADLYALGIVLYQMLTGRKPFQAHTIQGYLERHLHEQPRPPSELDPLVPALYEDVVMRLLRKSPSERYASATHLLHVLGDKDDDTRTDSLPPRSIGRVPVKAWIREVFDEVAQGHTGSALLLTGAPGLGKTQMIDLAEQAARRRGLPLARGRCRTSDRPFGAFFKIYEALRGDDPPEALVRTFEGSEVDLRAERYPVIAAFRDLVADRAPCVILLDELEKADVATRELVEYLVRNTLDLVDRPVAFVMAYETPGEATPSLLADVPAVDHLRLGPLEASEVEELVLTLLPDGPRARALAARLTEETGGSPSYLADVLRSLADEGTLARNDDGTWRLEVDPAQLHPTGLPLPDRLRSALAERLAPLTADASEVGVHIALARRSLDLDVLLELMDLAEDRLMDALDDLVDAGIVVERRQGDTERVELAHARFRDLLLEDLSDDDLALRHRRLGELLERLHRYAPGQVVEDLAYHFEQAGMTAKAYAYLLQVARKHLRRSLHDQSLAYLDRALALEPRARSYLLLDDADRRLAEIHLYRCRSLFHTGRWDEALQEAQAALAIAHRVRDDGLLARISAELGNLHRQRGDLDPAEHHLGEALHHADASGNQKLRLTPLYHLGAVRWSRRDLGGAEGHWRESLDLAKVLHADRAEARAYNGLGILAFGQGRSSEARKLLESSAALFEKLGMIETVATTRVNLIELYLSSGMLRQALELSDRTHGQAREIGHSHGIVMGLTWRARLMLVLGRSDEGRSNAREALRKARELGTLDEQILALDTLVQAMLLLGLAPFAARDVDQLLALLADSDYEGITPQVQAMKAQILWASGEREAAVACLEALDTSDRARPYVQVRIDLDVARSWRLVGEPRRGLPLLARAMETARTCRFRFYELLAHHELSQTVPDGEERTRHARKAKSQAKGLAVNLKRSDKTSFLGRGWGVPRS